MCKTIYYNLFNKRQTFKMFCFAFIVFVTKETSILTAV